MNNYAQNWIRLGSLPGDPGPRGDEGLYRSLRPDPPPRSDRPQRRLAGRSYGTGHLAERRAWAAREAVADHHPRRLQPRRGGLCAVRSAAPSAIQTALALRQAIWRKGRPGWQVCGIPGILYSDHGSDFTSRHLEQVAADLKIRLINSDGRTAPRPGEDRAVLRERLPGAPPAAARLRARRSRPESGADAGRDDRGTGAVPGRRVPQRTPHDDGVQAAGAVGRPAASCRGCPSRWSSSTCCC